MLNFPVTLNAPLVFLAAYLLGALPFGVITAKLRGVDIFQVGSGSTGATNVIRACGKWCGLAVFTLDVAKGALAAYLGLLFFPVAADPRNAWLVIICGFLALVGHSASVFIGFRGGKSAATGLGVALALDWRIFLAVAVFTLLVRQITGYQSVASLSAGLLALILFLLFSPYPAYQLLTLTGVVFVWIKHIPNIQRLAAGTETKITGRQNG
ncbi:glycerol-3-phosphate acyltransferase [Candidatus Termititenax aidoneus]|uniref:Glycerol-3-phosphate acyltransferase n=1 Tax=Termititenax aidoneus TaxID=2218524 RepID=A0A388TAQ8_TERA1|nr:glycerol-3-phosphate acyltransferase [Candidatus Termititenax aidoneus]